MTESAHDADLAALEAALARLAPPPDPLNRDQLLFRAGQESVRGQRRAWACATAASLLLSAALGAALLLRPGPQPAERVVFVRVETPPAAPPPAPRQPPVPDIPPPEPEDVERPPGDASYLELRRGVLAGGVEALPRPAPWPGPVRRSDLDTLLDLPPGSAREPWFLRIKNALESGDVS